VSCKKEFYAYSATSTDLGSCACSRSDVDRPRSMGSDASDGSVGREEATRGGSEGTAASRSEQRARAAAAREAGEAAGGEEGVAAAAERSPVGDLWRAGRRWIIGP